MDMPRKAKGPDAGVKTSSIYTAISSALPGLGLASLALCLVSGGLLAFHYRPFGDVFKNIEEITTHIPYGWYFRQVHYITGQAFVVLMLLHTADNFLRRRYRIYRPGAWFNLVFALMACFFILFTGFILKGDKEGLFAGTILSSIMETIPIAGTMLSRLLAGTGEDLFFIPYLHHCIFFPFLLCYLMRNHVRMWLPSKEFMISATLAASLYAVFSKLPSDIPPDAPVSVVTGPWFFLGVQWLLHRLDPLYAGILWPFVLVLLVLALRLPSQASLFRQSSKAAHLFETALYSLILCSLAGYFLLTIWAYAFGF
jgi:hypothetical protein